MRVVAAIMGKYGINSAEFARIIGKNPTYVNDVKNGKTKKISEQVAEKIIGQWPELSKIWVLTGEGQMLSTSTPASEPTAKAERSYSEPTLLQLYTEAIRENERLRMEVERLREKIAYLSERTSEVVTLPSDTI
jgi:hypothetical protein